MPGVADDQAFGEWWTRFTRLSASPGMLVALMKTIGGTDIRDVLPTISVPTLILHRTGDQVFDVRASRYMAKRIPNARLVELAGADHWPWVGDADRPLGEIEEFLTGRRPAEQGPRHSPVD